MLLIDVVRVSEAVTRTSSRLGKIGHLAELLGRVGPGEAQIAISYLSGELPQRQVGVGWRTLEDLPQPKLAATATLTAVDALLSRIKAVSGQGSQAARRTLVAELFAGLTSQEQQFMSRLLHGELRQGALDGVMIEAVAKASGAPASDVRRALTLRGSLPAVGAAALAGGVAALHAFRLEVGRAVSPMLAGSAPNVAAALEKAGTPAALEWKLDGVRVQAHRAGPEVKVFTRTLDDITPQVPELVEAVLEMPADDLVLDGEVIALRPDGRPHAFQVTASRVSSKTDVSRLRERTPLSVFFFDALRADGADLLDQPYAQRQETLTRLVPQGLLTPRLVTGEVAEAEQFFTDVVKAGHEGLVVKSLASPYAAGRRGAGWIKVKPRHTLDLVVLAAEWGHGRRQGKLSNLHLGARDPEGGFVMLGKTFKGMTDELLAWQTERFLELAEGPTDGWTVKVRPEVVVEIAFDGVQRSPRYPGGMALRFARVLRYRPDKRVEDADTVETVRALML
ncbi:ATP-dependent DNA ligase [Nonomuraea sp. KC401]|uniref:ATP-dependent DNA ligase n=1 Tax=unclassified Nonomuraea TaxID=2593643 RepID=UPI0010FF5D16|nr:ATP-dependent DNA ligase [Nonomuraea sp. KC401]NBE95329.1 ATP-dependent DNA ligase [Nonomuraea sp. K271]TLF72183.1 ATP-dependent DNA ligase [Nonomuraea sp. KC401]